MPRPLDLKRLERQAWQSYLQDGLTEVFLGGLLLLAFVASISGEGRFLVYIPMLLLGPGLVLAKRLITVPRLGRVRFGPERRARRWRLAAGAAVVFVLTVALLVVTVRGGLPGEWLREHHAVVSLGLGGVVALLFAAAAYWKDFPRLYLLGLIIGTAFALTELLHTSVPLLVAGGVVLAVGLAILVRFLRQYPVPSDESPHTD